MFASKYSILLTGALDSGTGGNLTINTRRLIVGNNRQIVSGAFDEGHAGNVTINASEMIKIIGNEQINDTTVPTGILTGTLDKGKAGNLTINTKRLIVQNGAQIQSATDGVGNGVNLNLNASESIYLSGNKGNNFSYSGLFASGNIPINLNKKNVGGAGNIRINTDQIVIQYGASVSARNEVDRAGNIEIIANSIRLNSGTVTAETRGNSGNITLNSRDLILRNNSQITTNARGKGTGGNIIIDSKVIVALENSDITTNAEGQG